MTASPASIFAGRQVHMMGSPVEAMTIVGEDKEWGRRRRTVTRVKREAIDIGIRDSRLTFSLAAPVALAVETVLDKLFNSVSTSPAPRFSGETTHFFPSHIHSLSTYCPAYNLLPFKTMVQ